MLNKIVFEKMKTCYSRTYDVVIENVLVENCKIAKLLIANFPLGVGVDQ